MVDDDEQTTDRRRTGQGGSEEAQPWKQDQNFGLIIDREFLVLLLQVSFREIRQSDN